MLVVACGDPLPSTSIDSRRDGSQSIVGGADTTIDAHPWQVSLQSGGNHFCGGSVIAAEWILTAQHCVDGNSAGNITVDR